MNDKLQDQILSRAKLALGADSDNSDHLYNDLIEELERLFGKNHKEVAAELQRLAKAIEEAGGPEEAFYFKQRTCEMLLRRNMEERRLARQQSPSVVPSAQAHQPASPPPVLQKRLLAALEYVCHPTDNAARDSDFYKSSFGGERVVEHNSAPRCVGFKMAAGPALLFIEEAKLEATQPVYCVDSCQRVLTELEKQGVSPVAGPIVCGLGTIFTFKDPSGNRFAILEKKR